MIKQVINSAKWLNKFGLGILLSLILFGCSQHAADSYDSQGKVIRLSQYLGKWVIINYWATWCKPCLSEMPILEKLQDQYKDRLVVLGVSFDKLDNNAINAVAKKYLLTYPLLSSFSVQEIGVEQIAVLPITFIINPQGKLVKTLKGPQTATQFLAAIGMQHG